MEQATFSIDMRVMNVLPICCSVKENEDNMHKKTHSEYVQSPLLALLEEPKRLPDELIN